MQTLEQLRQQDKKHAAAGYKGIGGWLVLPMLGLMLAPLSQVYSLFSVGDALSLLPQLDIVRGSFLVFELVGSVLLGLAAPIILLMLFFGERAAFPGLFIAQTLAMAAFTIVDLALGYALFKEAYALAGQAFFDRETVRALVSTAIGVFIWVPYMLNSVRVKNTFVK